MCLLNKIEHLWYNSPEYAPLKALRQSGIKNNAVFMESESIHLPEREKE
jgi:uncharacterized protein (DUF1330 family)